MIFLKRLCIPLMSVFLASVVHANPPDAQEDLGRFLESNGLLLQIGQVRQTVTQVGLSVTSQATDLVGNALAVLGAPYRRGGMSVDTGFDCSGFVKTMYQQTIGLILPRKAEQQAAATEQIERDELRPGDLVFFNTMRRAFSHVGIYIGEGQFVHSPKPGAQVRVDNMAQSYWSRKFDGARRVQALRADLDVGK